MAEQDPTLEVGTILSKITAFNNGQDALRTRHDDDLELYRLAPYKVKAGYLSYTTNAPQVLANKVISILTSAELNIRVPLDTLDKEERISAGVVERFLYGALNLNDDRLMLLDEPTLRDQMTWLAVVRGGFALRIFVNKDADTRETIPEVVVWDIHDTAYLQGAKGLVWGACTQQIPLAVAREEFGMTSFGADAITTVPASLSTGAQQTVALVDWWNKKENGIIIGGQWAKKPEAHGLDYCPIFIFHVGPMPNVTSGKFADTYKLRGESVYASNRNIYPVINHVLSDQLTLVHRGVKPPLVMYSVTGKKTIDSDIYQSDKTATLSMRVNEKIEPLVPVSMPGDTKPLLDFTSIDEQKGGLPATTYGQLGFRLSGFAINQLQSSLTTVVTPFVSALKRSYTVMCKELMRQFTDSFKSIKVKGKTSRGASFGYPMAEEISSKDLKRDWLPEVNLKPDIPEDEAQKFYLANLARQGELPLLSDLTIRDEIIGIKDPMLEENKVLEQSALMMTRIRLKRVFDALLARGAIDEAIAVWAEIQQITLAGEQQGKGGGANVPPGGMPGPLEQMAGASPGAGMPPGETGAPTHVMPSESLGGMPGGAMNAGEMVDYLAELAEKLGIGVRWEGLIGDGGICELRGKR